MPSEFTVRRRVEFSETDMAGIMHFSNFFRFMETAEHAFYRSLGFSVVHDRHVPPVGFPRVHASCDYTRPLRFEDEVEIHLRVIEKKDKALTHQIIFRRVTHGQVQEVARGKLVVVCVTKNADGSMAAVSIPKDMADRIEVAPPLPADARQ
jgi:acyl-CoA thioester hydrolase